MGARLFLMGITKRLDNVEINSNLSHQLDAAVPTSRSKEGLPKRVHKNVLREDRAVTCWSL